MPVRTVTTFIPPVAAKSYSGLSGSLTPVHPHLSRSRKSPFESKAPVQVGPSPRGRSRQGNIPDITTTIMPDRCVKAQANFNLLCDGRMRSTITTFIPSQSNTHTPCISPMADPNNAATQRDNFRGVPIIFPRHSTATLHPPTVSKGPTSRSSRCFGDTPQV